MGVHHKFLVGGPEQQLRAWQGAWPDYSLTALRLNQNVSTTKVYSHLGVIVHHSVLVGGSEQQLRA